MGFFLLIELLARHPTVDFLFLLPASGKSYLSINLCCAISGVSNAAVVCCHPSDGLGVVANRISINQSVIKYGKIQLCSITVAYFNKPLSVDGVVNPKSSSKGLGVVSVSFSSGRALCISTKLLKTNRVTTERIISP